MGRIQSVHYGGRGGAHGGGSWCFAKAQPGAWAEQMLRVMTG